MAVLLLLICSPVDAAISISGVGAHGNPLGSNEGLSGICYAGGTQYYAVDDSGGLMQPATISVNTNSGAITAASFSTAITLGGLDLEGIDYNVVNNSLLVSDESGATIKEYTLTGSFLSSVTVPPIFASYRSNYSLESFTIRGNGLEMWTCNEEALVDDGPLSNDSDGTVVRLQRFTRSSVHDIWLADGQWAYLTESYEDDSDFTSAERSGVSDLCVLPDGTLLVLERTLGYSTFIPHFENRIYEINVTGATDVSAITSLNGATYTHVTKIQHWSGSFSTTYNFEGLCLGPRLDGNALSLIMIADGDGDQDNGLYALKLTGLTTRQLTVNTPAYGVADPVGGPYRYEAGTSVTSTITGSPALQNGYRYECTGWTVTSDTPTSGTDTNIQMTLSNDLVLTWLWATNSVQTALGTPIWWLISHGLDEADDDQDADSDGMLTWQEWVSDTDPTNYTSALKLTDIDPSGAGTKVYWKGGMQAVQVLERRTNLVLETDWTPVFTNLPPTSVTNDFTDPDATGPSEFYRLKAWR